jgi:glucokinase
MVQTTNIPTAMQGEEFHRGCKLSALPPYLVADIGGTTTRVAAASGSGILSSVEVTTSDEGAADPINLLVKVRSSLSDCKYGAIAVAGKVDTDKVQLTNRAWNFSRAELERKLGLRKLIVVNDFVAMAHAIGALGSADLKTIREGRGKPNAPRLVCGPGTGFGLAVVYGHRDVIPTEAGHLRLGGIDRAEAELFEQISRGQPENLVVEDLISGRGLVSIHRIISGKEESSKAIITAAEIGNEPAIATIETFLRIFGRIAANLSLLFDARGGLYIGGGVGASLLNFYTSPKFMGWFEKHPSYREVLANIPIRVVTHAVPGLVGALQIVRNEFIGKPSH